MKTQLAYKHHWKSSREPQVADHCSKASVQQEKRVRVEHRSSVVCMSSYEANKQHIRAPPPCFADIQLRVLSNLYYGHVISKLRSSEKEDL